MADLWSKVGVCRVSSKALSPAPAQPCGSAPHPGPTRAGKPHHAGVSVLAACSTGVGLLVRDARSFLELTTPRHSRMVPLHRSGLQKQACPSDLGTAALFLLTGVGNLKFSSRGCLIAVGKTQSFEIP